MYANHHTAKNRGPDTVDLICAQIRYPGVSNQLQLSVIPTHANRPHAIRRHALHLEWIGLLIINVDMYSTPIGLGLHLRIHTERTLS